MKSLIGLICALCCAPAFAAGAYDGVYQYGLSPAYYSVHQQSGTMLVVALGELPTVNIPITLGPGYVVSPNSINYWTYAIGAINGNSARLTSTVLFGACNVTTDLSFDGAGNAFATFVSVTTTFFGSQQGVNCSSLYQSILASIGPTVSLRKIF